MNQLKSIYNSPFKDSRSHRSHTHFVMIASNYLYQWLGTSGVGRAGDWEWVYQQQEAGVPGVGYTGGQVDQGKYTRDGGIPGISTSPPWTDTHL